MKPMRNNCTKSVFREVRNRFCVEKKIIAPLASYCMRSLFLRFEVESFEGEMSADEIVDDIASRC